MHLVTMGKLQPDEFINMFAPLFHRNSLLEMCMNQMRAILHVPIHYFHSSPLYAPFLTNLSTNDKNMNLSLRGTADQYSQICDFYGSSIRTNSLDSNSYRRNPYYKKNLVCSTKKRSHLEVVNDEYVCTSNALGNEHSQLHNKHELELNEKEHIMTLWDYYCEQNLHAIEKLRALESRILQIFDEYRKMFIIHGYSDDIDEKMDDDRSTIVDETNFNFYDSDNYTTWTENAIDNVDSAEDQPKCSMNDGAHSTSSEPFFMSSQSHRESKLTHSHSLEQTPHESPLSLQPDCPQKNGGSPAQRSNKKLTFPVQIQSKSTPKRKKAKYQNKTETDKQYILCQIYADLNLDEFITPICWSAIRRLYAEQAQAVWTALNENPLSAITTILPRLEKKQEEWDAERKKIRQMYRDVATRNSYKALNLQPNYKRLDKIRLSKNEMYRELVMAQSVLNPNLISIIENQRQKRSCSKPKQWQKLSSNASPMDAESSIKPTRLIQKHFRPKLSTKSTKWIMEENGKRQKTEFFIAEEEDEDGDDMMHENGQSPQRGSSAQEKRAGHRSDYRADLRMNFYYNYGLRFDLKYCEFQSANNYAVSSHENCYNVFIEFLKFEQEHKRIKGNLIEDVVKFYSNFFLLFFEVDFCHQEKLPHIYFKNIFKPTEKLQENTQSPYKIKFDEISKLKQIGATIQELTFKPLSMDINKLSKKELNLHDASMNDSMMSFHTRRSHVMFINQEIFYVLRLYLHLWQRLERARHLSTNRWQLNYNPDAKDQNNKRQEDVERKFYFILYQLLENKVKEMEFDSLMQQLFGPQGYQCTNIKYVIKQFKEAIRNILNTRNFETVHPPNSKQTNDNITWEILRLWHFYDYERKQIPTDNIRARIALNRRYFSDVQSLLSPLDAVVMVEYFVDSQELGVQFLGSSNENGCIQSHSAIRCWQIPIQSKADNNRDREKKKHHHDSLRYSACTKNIKSVHFMKKKLAVIEKYRHKISRKDSKNINASNRSSSYKRVNGTIGDITMTLQHDRSNASKRHSRRSRKSLFPGFAQSMDVDAGNASDDSTMSKSRRKRRKKKHQQTRNAHDRNNGSLLNRNRNHNHHDSHNNNGTHQNDPGGDETSSVCWYHPNSQFYFQSVNLSKVQKRPKVTHMVAVNGKMIDTQILATKWRQMKKKFTAFHDKKFKELEMTTKSKTSASNNNSSLHRPLHSQNAAMCVQNTRGSNNHHAVTSQNNSLFSNPNSLNNPNTNNHSTNTNMSNIKGILPPTTRRLFQTVNTNNNTGFRSTFRIQ